MIDMRTISRRKSIILRYQTFSLVFKTLAFALFIMLLSPMCTFAKDNEYTIAAGYVRIQNREPSKLSSPVLVELAWNIPIDFNKGYEMVAHLGFAEYGFLRRERGNDVRHIDQAYIAGANFVNNERDGGEFYYGAGGGFGGFSRTSKVFRGAFEGDTIPNSSGSFMYYQAVTGFGWYDGGTGSSLEFKWANWGGLFVVVSSLTVTF